MTTFVTRAQWGARNARTGTPRTDPIFGITVHHSTGATLGAAYEDDWVRNIQRYHMDTLGYVDIAYNTLIGPSGQVFVGRSNDIVGAHAASANNSANRATLGVCFLGDYRTRVPTKEAIAALDACVWLTATSIGHKPWVTDHEWWRNAGGPITECPGDALQWVINGRYA